MSPKKATGRVRTPGMRLPYVALAALCERVLEERDGTLSLIRVVDRITTRFAGASEFPKEYPLPFALVLVVSLRGGEVGSTHHIRIEPHPPGQKAGAPLDADVILGGVAPGANLILRLPLQSWSAGRHEFHVSVDGDKKAEIPLEIEYLPLEPSN